MKRRELLRHLQAYGCELLREGGKYSIYWNPTSRRTSSIPRHNEIVDLLAKKICRDLNISEPWLEPPSPTVRRESAKTLHIGL